MGLFNKEYCSICNKNLNLIDTVKLSDAKICKKCFSKKSFWTSPKPANHNLRDFSKHLEYRSRNLEKLAAFAPSVVVGEGAKIYVDEKNKQFCVLPKTNDKKPYKSLNPDIIPFDELLTFNTSEEQIRIEIRISSGDNYYSFTPPAYAVYYNFHANFVINNEYLDNISIKFNEYEVGVPQPWTVEVPKFRGRWYAKRPYGGYEGRTDNDDRVKQSNDYKKYHSYLEQINRIFERVKPKEEQDYCQYCGVKFIDDSIVSCPCCGAKRY